MPYCIADGFAQYLLCKTITAGSGTAKALSFYGTSGNTQTVTYTTTQTYEKMYLVATWTVSQERYYGGEGASITIKVGNTTVLNRSIAKNENGSEQVVVNNVSSGSVITATIVPPSRGGNAGAYWDNSISGTI